MRVLVTPLGLGYGMEPVPMYAGSIRVGKSWMRVLFIIPKLAGRFAGPNFPRLQKQMLVLCQPG